MKKLNYSFSLLIASFLLFANMQLMAQGNQSITILQPTEANTEIAMGEHYLISWERVNFVGGQFDILLVNKDDNSETTIEEGVSGTTWIWNTEDDGDLLNYDDEFTIKVRGHNDNTVSGESENPFTIVSTIGGFITMEQPTTNSTWVKGSEYWIAWLDNIDEAVKVSLYTKTNGDLSATPVVDNIATTTGSTTTWTVPLDENVVPAADNYVIVVSSSVQGSTTNPAISDKFSIVASSGTFIDVLQPNESGIKWAVGTEHLISWNTDIQEGVFVELLKKNTAGDYVLVNPANSGLGASTVTGTTLNWDIPETLPTTLDYKIRVRTEDNSILKISNKHFDLIATTGTFVDVENPVAGDKWKRGTEHLISWNDDLPGDVVVELTKKNTAGDWVAVGGSTGLDGNPVPGSTLNWNIDENLAPGNYKIHIYADDDNDIDVYSSKFQVVLTIGSVYAIYQPMGGEQWEENSSHLISWNDDLTEGVILTLLTNSSGSWVEVPGNTGLSTTPVEGTTFSWPIVDFNGSITYGNHYKIRIASSEDPNVKSESGKFSIIQPVIMSAFPNPANQSFTLSVGNTIKGKYTVELYDRYNNRIMETEGNAQVSNKLKVSTSELSDGIYFMIVTSNNERTTKKIVVNHK